MIFRDDLSRRTMLKTLLWTPPALLLCKGCIPFSNSQSPALFRPRIVPQGEKIRVAQVGVFNRGDGVLKEFARYSDTQVEFKAFADVLFTSHNYRLGGYEHVACYRDYRRMLEEMHDEIDALIVCTPDHAHFPVVMHAMLLGKHVYVEKPLAQNVYECRVLEQTARRCGVVTQLGNQGHSGAGTLQFGQWVEAGLIRNVTRIDAWMSKSRRWHGWSYTDYPEQIPPSGYDWDQWLGRRPFRPYSDKMVGGNWRCWYEFGCGAMGDWGAHVLDAYHRYLKLSQPYEIKTKLVGPSDLYYPQGSVITFRFKARGDMPPVELNWYDGQGNIPDPPSGYTLEMDAVGSIAYAEDVWVSGTSHGAQYHFSGNRKLQQAQEAGKLPVPPENLPNHYQNFLNACQGIEAANSPFEVGAPLSEMLCLGCIGQRFGGDLQYDAKNMKITNHPQADAMLRGPAVREPWNAYDRYRPAPSKNSLIRKPGQVSWEPLILDESLSNWENPYEWGHAEYDRGMIRLTSDKEKWFLLTRREFDNFVFEGEVRLPAGRGNSGFLFRCQQQKNRAWGYQAEVDPSPRKWSGGLFDEGRRNWFISPDKANESSVSEFRKRAGESYKQGQWNRYRIVCIGSHIRIYVNDVLTTDVHDAMDLKGHIGLQHHGEQDLVYEFRNLRIQDLGVGGEIYYPHREDAKPPAVAPKMEGDNYEAEDAKLSGCQKADNHTGYQGTGYADFGEAGSFVEWDNVLAEDQARYTLSFRYATMGDRPCKLIVNDRETETIPFANTGDWTVWKTVKMRVDLKKGGNFIRVVAIDKGPNLDALAVNR